MCFKKNDNINNINNINYEIKANLVRIIDDAELNIVMKLNEAINLAKKKKLDLVQINYDGKLPVCKILDFKKYLYNKKKLLKENKKNNKSLGLKEIYMRPNISISDFDIKLRKAVGFLVQGNNVKFLIKFVGREISYPNLGIELLDKITNYLCKEKKIAYIYANSNKIDNRQIFTLFSPIK